MLARTETERDARLRKAKHRTIGAYKTYNFKDKDPVIDILRRLVELDAAAASLSFGKMLERVEQRSGVSSSTLYNWFNGPTCRPQFATVQAVARALGKSFKLK